MIRSFASKQFGEIRTSVSSDGTPLFSAPDVCAALDIRNPSDAVSRLDADEKFKLSVEAGQKGGARWMVFVNEYGLWELVFTSRKAQAQEFKRWVAHEVIPSIRKNGFYLEDQELLTDEEMKDLLGTVSVLKENLAKEREARESADAQLYEIQKEIGRGAFFELLESCEYYD